jgi:hypothetical protein
MKPPPFPDAADAIPLASKIVTVVVVDDDDEEEEAAEIR